MTANVYSMTGFARCEKQTALGGLCWEIRSVNHRYLDVSLRLHESLRSIESDLRGDIAAKLGRGKVDCSLTVDFGDDSGGTLSLDNHLLRSLRDAAATAQQIYRGATQPSALDLLKWPGVVREQRPDVEALADDIRVLLGETLDALLAMRAREGAHLVDTLMQRCADIESMLLKITERRPDVIAASRTRLEERLARLDLETDPARLETEVVIQAQKLDVDEELDRLKGHLHEARRILSEGSPCGRKLDFLIQEFNREANTIGSKSADGPTTSIIVDMKVAIEQMREQVQNIE
ncbi:MAG: YicC/YloC family endoribonuclease [Pseudomonadota bacterium]